MLLTITWTLADSENGQQTITLPATVTDLINSVRDRLTEPQTLRRVLGYAQAALPVLADAAGLGIAGQRILFCRASSASPDTHWMRQSRTAMECQRRERNHQPVKPALARATSPIGACGCPPCRPVPPATSTSPARARPGRVQGAPARTSLMARPASRSASSQGSLALDPGAMVAVTLRLWCGAGSTVTVQVLGVVVCSTLAAG